MKKIVPVIMLILSSLALVASIMALVFLCGAFSTPLLAIIGMPLGIGTLILSAVCALLDFLFKKDILCKIALGISLTAFAATAAAIIILACALNA